MRPSSRPFARIRTTAGFLSLVACFALASPGVEIVRAEPPAAQPGAQCGLQKSAAGADAEVASFLAELRREHAARLAAEGAEGPEVIVLNNRGYNYGPPRGIRLDGIRAEVLQPSR